MVSKVTGALFGSSPKPASQPTGYETLPQFGKDLLQQIINQGKSFTETNALSQNESDILKLLSQGVPNPQVTPAGGFQFGQRASGAFNQAGDLFSRASQFLERGGQAIGRDELQSAISDVMNPFESDVISAFGRDLTEFGQGAFSDARGLISDAGASGSNRAQFLAGDIAGDLNKTFSDYSSGLRRSGFETAASNALSRLQGDRNSALSAGSGLTNTGNSFTNLGSNLMGAREAMDRIRGTARTQNMQDLTTRLGASQQIRNAPMENIDFLSKLFQLIPTGGGGTGAREGQKGLFGTGGSDSFGNILTAFFA